MSDVNDLNEAHQAGYGAGYAAGRAGLTAELKAADRSRCVWCGLLLAGPLTPMARAQIHLKVCHNNPERAALDRLLRLEHLLSAFSGDPEHALYLLIQENVRYREIGARKPKRRRAL